MKFTLSWLRDHLETEATLDQITDTLTAIGLEVERVIDPSAALAPFIVAEILEAEPHPGADKLRVCKVNDGASVRQIVCGAPNARAGIKVVLAKEGVYVPGSGITIKKTSIRNVESNGMLCSAHELGIGEDGGGILELPAEARPGESIVGVLRLDDPVIEIAITPNRADCLGVRGVARDLAAAGIGTLKPEILGFHPKGSFASPVRVTLETEFCPLFIGCTIRGVKNGPSPDWLQQRLKAIGLRPISALVDITNYMTFTYGRPLHVFDAQKLSGGITVRMAREGEKLLALDNKEYTLTPEMIAVCDASGVVGLGGVMGGIATSCTETTQEVFLESALFDPAHIAATGRRLQIESDARYRFERGIDPAFAQKGAEIAIALILDLCGGEASERVVAGKVPQWQRNIAFDESKVETLGGISLPKEQIEQVLGDLGFGIEAGQVMPPSWRADIEGQADLVEEVIRIARYDNILPVALPRVGAVPLTPIAKRTALMRKTLAVQGLAETYSFAFVSREKAVLFGSTKEALQLLNPIHAELDTMRPHLLPGLLGAAARNASRGAADTALFEIGNVFEDITPEGQKLMVAGLRAGMAAPRSSFKTQREVDAFDAKADLFAVLKAAGLNAPKLAIDRTVPSWYHPARSGRISLGGKVTLGYFGELHPLTLAQFDIRQRVVAFEAFTDAMPLPKAKGKTLPPLVLSAFQAVERDFAFTGEEKILAADIVKAVEGAEKQLIKSVSVFDIYTGKGVEPGKKSIALSVSLQATDRTLTDQEIDAVAQKIIAAVKALGLTLRQ